MSARLRSGFPGRVFAFTGKYLKRINIRGLIDTVQPGNDIDKLLHLKLEITKLLEYAQTDRSPRLIGEFHEAAVKISRHFP